MGQDQDTLNRGDSARSDRRLRPRICLRKGCGQTYQPHSWNQRYCQDPDCLHALRRWQATKRQREHRRVPQNRQRHASAEAARRERRRKASETAGQSSPSRFENSPDRRAWSRSKNNSPDFCDRPGCYEPPRPTHAPRTTINHPRRSLSCHAKATNNPNTSKATQPTREEWRRCLVRTWNRYGCGTTRSKRSSNAARR